MATQERVAAPFRSALFRGHHRHGRRTGAFSGIYGGLPNRKHGQRFREARQSVGHPTASPVFVLDARSSIFIDPTFVHRSRLVGRQTHDRGENGAGRPRTNW